VEWEGFPSGICKEMEFMMGGLEIVGEGKKLLVCFIFIELFCCANRVRADGVLLGDLALWS